MHRKGITGCKKTGKTRQQKAAVAQQAQAAAEELFFPAPQTPRYFCQYDPVIAFLRVQRQDIPPENAQIRSVLIPLPDRL